MGKKGTDTTVCREDRSKTMQSARFMYLAIFLQLGQW